MGGFQFQTTIYYHHSMFIDDRLLKALQYYQKNMFNTITYLEENGYIIGRSTVMDFAHPSETKLARLAKHEVPAQALYE